MEVFITGLHIGLCFFLLLVVLLQPGKGADFGAAMGGASQEVFGATGGVSLLSKITAAGAAMFMGTSLSLAWFSNAPPGTDLTPEQLMEGALAPSDAPEDAPLPSEEPAVPAPPAEEPAASDGAPGAAPAAGGTETPEPASEPAAPVPGGTEAAPKTD